MYYTLHIHFFLTAILSKLSHIYMYVNSITKDWQPYNIKRWRILEMDLKAYTIVFFAIHVICCHATYMTATFCNSSHYVIVAQPLDITVKEGEDAVFSCTVSQFDPDTDEITWIVDPSRHSSIRSVGFDHSTGQITSSIGFSNIGREGHTQKCVYRKINTKKELTVCTSREAQLTVLFFPKKNDLFCSPSLLHNIREGRPLQIRCEVLEGNPPVNISLIMDGMKMSSSYTFHERSKVISHNLNVNSELHNRTIQCLVTSETFFPGEQLECNIGPIEVLHKPVIHVHPAYGELRGENDTIQIRCDGDAYPPIQQITWSCTPPDILSRCNTDSNIINLSLANSFGTNTRAANKTKVFIICNAWNSEGMSNAAAEITIIQSVTIRKYISTCPNISLILQHVDTASKNMTASFLCFVTNVDSLLHVDESNILWYFDGDHSHHLRAENISIENNSSSSSVLTITNIENFVERYIQISCEYQDGNCAKRKHLILDDFYHSIIHPNLTSQTNFIEQTPAIGNNGENRSKSIDGFDAPHSDEKNLYVLNIIIGISIIGCIIIAACLSTVIKLVFHKYFQQNGRTIKENSEQESENSDNQESGQFEVSHENTDPNYEDPPVADEAQADQENYHIAGNRFSQYDMHVSETYQSSDTYFSNSSGSSLSSGELVDQLSHNTNSLSTDSINLTDGQIHLYEMRIQH